MNATHEVSAGTPDSSSANMTRALQYMGRPSRPMRSTYDPQVIKMLMAHELVHDVDAEFAQYMKLVNFTHVENSGRLEMKKKHTIIEKWPMKLNLQPGQKGAKEEFELLLSSAHTGQERYVEWRVKQQQQQQWELPEAEDVD